MVVDTLTPARLGDRLLRLVTARAEAVATLELRTVQAIESRTAYDNTQALKVRDGLEGKNEREREALLRLACVVEHDRLIQAERTQREARHQLDQLDAELSVLKALARLLSGEA